MKTAASILSLFSIYSCAFAENCANETALRQDAVKQLYGDRDVIEYVCGPSPSCSEQQFASELDAHPIVLTPGAVEPDGLAVTPKTKGVAFFTALFLRENCSYRVVFSPDSSSSGLKVLPKEMNGKYMLVSTDRSSRSEWADTEYMFDTKTGVYQMGQTKCFASIGGKTVQLPKCE